jgi:hypothetical protein
VFQAPARPHGAPPPKAYVWDFADKWTHRTGAEGLLKWAGFDVEPLPLDRSPFELKGLIFLASFISEDPKYAPYMKQYAADLYNFVDKGNVLLQMTQADQTEAAPPFLPTTHGAKRADGDFDVVFVLSRENPLLAGVQQTFDGKLQMAGKRVVWECFVDQGGFEVILAGDPHAQYPALMEGAYGQGRIILSSLAFDKVVDADGKDVATEPQRKFNGAFFKNLYQHVIDVRDRRTRAVAVTASPQVSTTFVPGSWTLAVLRDTQVYALRYPGLYVVQIDWVKRNREARNIVYAIQLGDITNINTPTEWKRAREAWALLDGELPYVLNTGNHDYGPSGDASSRDTLLNEYFEFDRHASQRGFGEAMERGKLDNSYHLFEAGGRKWIVLALEWGPRDSTIAWANQIMKRHPDRVGILTTHAYVNNNDLRYDWNDKKNPQHYNPHEYRTPGGVNDGEELWQKLVRHYNFAFVLNGHVLGDGTGYLASKNNTGTQTHQILSNYQMRTLGGEGYLRLMEFLPDGQSVRVRTYSPLYDRYLLDQDQHFDLTMDQRA